jgi:hypothetical protein
MPIPRLSMLDFVDIYPLRDKTLVLCVNRKIAFEPSTAPNGIALNHASCGTTSRDYVCQNTIPDLHAALNVFRGNVGECFGRHHLLMKLTAEDLADACSSKVSPTNLLPCRTRRHLAAICKSGPDALLPGYFQFSFEDYSGDLAASWPRIGRHWGP